MDLGYEHLPQTWDMSILRGPGIRAFSRFWNMSIILPANSHVQPSPWGPGGGGHIILFADPHVQPSPWGPGGGGHNLYSLHRKLPPWNYFVFYVIVKIIIMPTHLSLDVYSTLGRIH